MEHNHMLARPRDDSAPGGQQEKHLRYPKHNLQTSPDFESPSDQNPIHLQSHLQSPYPPPSYAQFFDPPGLSLPDAPTTELAPIQPYGDHGAASKNILPSLSSLTASQPRSYTPSQPSEPSCSPPPPRPTNNWPSMNPLTTYYTSSHARNADTPQRMDIDVASSGSTMSTASPDRFPEGRASSINLDDPDVLLAAEALGDLRADFVSSPPNQPTPLPANSPQGRSAPTAGPEPLLSLLTTSHPLIATTIEGATSVYNNGKNLNPTIRNSVEYVEGYLGPIATTFGSVSRATGVDGGVRWFLGGVGRRDRSSTSDLEAGGSGSNKRRKVDTSPQDVVLDGTPDKPEFELYGFTSDRRTSMSTVDTLPAYDEFRSPAYSETADAQARVALRPNPGAPAAWPHRLMLSTSGLSIAMREESLRSLKYCLNWLRWANEHIAKVIAALNTALDQYERSADGSTSGDPASQRQSDHDMQDATTTPTMSGSVASQHDRGEIAARIVALKGDVLKTLRGVIETVSKYAGGALPDNARSLVHRHLTSLPQRFLLATKQDMSTVQQGHGVTGEEEVREGAQRALVLAKEGLDMMAQVSGVLDGTIVSAEEWCELLRKKKGDDQGASAADPTSEPQPPPADGTEAR